MKRFLSLIVVMAAATVLSSCIYSKTPNQSEVTVHADELISFSVNVFPEWNASKVKWYLDDLPIPFEYGAQATFAPTPWEMGTHTLKAVSQFTDFTWNITVLESLFVKPEDFGIDEAKQALYAAYAGIGYNTTFNRDDDEMLYDVMLADLNYLVAPLTLNAIINNEISVLISKMTAYFLYFPVTFNYSDGSGSYRLRLQQTSPGKFKGTLYADFNSNGFLLGECYTECPSYYGSNNTDDLIVSVTGKLRATADPPDIEELSLDSVSITTKSTLLASYPMGDVIYDVSYDNWNISYQGENPVNSFLVPAIIGSELPVTDLRDYVVSGSFTVNDGTTPHTYMFRDGFHYTQNEVDGKKTIAIAGNISPPALSGGLLAIETSDIEIDEYGIWTSGRLSIPVKNSTSRITIDFNDGVAVFSGQGAFEDLDETIDNWQNMLDPYPYTP